MSRLLRISILIFLLQFNQSVLAQPLSRKIGDVMKAELKTALNDTVRVLKLQKLSLYYITKAGEEKADMDSSYVCVREAELLSDKIGFRRGKWMSLILYSQIYREGGNPKKGRKELDKAFEISKRNKIYWLEGEAYRELTNYYDLETQCDVRIKIVAKSLAAFRKGGTKKQIADILVYYGGHALFNCDFNEALQKFNEAELIYDVIGYTDLQNLCSQFLATYSRLGLYPEAIKYGLKSIKTAEQNKDYFFLIEDYNNLGYAYYYLENYESALKYHQKSLDYSLKIFSEFYPLYNASCIIKDLVKLGRKKEAKYFLDTTVKNLKIKDYRDLIWLDTCYIILYDEFGWYKLADKYKQKLADTEEKKRKLLPDFYILEINNTIITHLFKTKNYELAYQHLKENKKIAGNTKDINMLMNIHLMEFKLDSASGKYLSAIVNLKKYQKAKDNLFSDVKSYQISNLEVKYQTENKDQNIQLLTKESALQKAKIKSDKVAKVIAALVLFLVLIITGLIFKSYHNKKKSNEKLQISKDRIAKKNKILQNVVQEKEWLLKEIHHRVKNNLQVVMSLLNTQSAYLKDESAVMAIKESQNRINSMSLIHQRLYQTEGLSCIKMPEYIKELISHLKDSYPVNYNFVLAIEDIEMHVSQAIPIGLILNEGITNAIKYAFPNGEKGTITITLKHFEDDYFLLEIADNGVGIDGKIDVSKYNSLGMKLMEGLTHDLNGKFEVINENGLKIRIPFIYDYTFKFK